MSGRLLMALVLIAFGAGAVVLGARGWTHKREPVEDSTLELALGERETSPILAILGVISLATGLVTLRAGRDRSPR